MPPLQQLLRGYRTCQALSHLQLQTPCAQPLRFLHAPGTTAAAGRILGQHRRCKASTGSLPCASMHNVLHISNSNNSRQPLHQGQQHWGSSTRSSRQASRCQHVCQASSSTPQPAGGSSTVGNVQNVGLSDSCNLKAHAGAHWQQQQVMSILQMAQHPQPAAPLYLI